MDAAALSPEEARELALLRRRAYGPDSDIGLDPAARSRLERLEAACHARAPSASAHAPADAPHPPRAVTSQASASAPSEPQTWREPADATGWLPERRTAPRAAPFLRGLLAPRRRVWLAAGAVAVVAALVWAGTQVFLPRADLTLGRIPAGEAARSFAGQGYFASHSVDVAGVERYEDYGSLQIWLTTSTTGERCLVVDADDYGIVGIGCTPPGLDPIVDVRIWRGMRRDVFGELPAGTVLRFQQSEDRVYLWVRRLPLPD
jgi:hypothetical protein